MAKNYNGLRNIAIVYGGLCIALIGCKIASLLPISWWGVVLLAIALPVVVVIAFIWAIIAL